MLLQLLTDFQVKLIQIFSVCHHHGYHHKQCSSELALVLAFHGVILSAWLQRDKSIAKTFSYSVKRNVENRLDLEMAQTN